jgi:long-chain acyl-CoA synthetase
MNAKPWFAHYEQGVPQTVAIPEIPLPQLLVDAAQKYPNNIAIRMILKYLPLGLSIGSKMTYRELNDASDHFAAALQKLGVQKGDRVSLMLPNVPQYVIAYFGVMKAGAVVVNTNPTYTPRELRHQLEDSAAKVIVLMSGLYERLAQIREHTKVEQVIIADVPDSGVAIQKSGGETGARRWDDERFGPVSRHPCLLYPAQRRTEQADDLHAAIG